MPSYSEVELILLQARGQEEVAEKNCDLLLKELKVNGFGAEVLKIKNDEIKHQEIVDDLVELLRKR